LQQIDQVLCSQGYQKEKDTPGELLYGRGSKAGRILGGGLSSRQEFRVTSEADGGLVLVTIRGTASVMKTGALGISKMRKELARLSGLILTQFPPCPRPQDAPPGDLGRFAAVMTAPDRGRANEYVVMIVVILIVVIGVFAGLIAVAWAVLG